MATIGCVYSIAPEGAGSQGVKIHAVCVCYEGSSVIFSCVKLVSGRSSYHTEVTVRQEAKGRRRV